MINYRGVARCVCVCVYVCVHRIRVLEPWIWKKMFVPWFCPGASLALFLTPCSPNTSTANRCKVESKFVHVCSKVTSPVSIPYWLEIYMIYSVAMVAVVAVAMVLMVLMVVMVVTVSSLVFCRCHHYHHCDWCAAVSFVNVVPWGPWNTFGVNLLASSHLTSPLLYPGSAPPESAHTPT